MDHPADAHDPAYQCLQPGGPGHRRVDPGGAGPARARAAPLSPGGVTHPLVALRQQDLHAAVRPLGLPGARPAGRPTRLLAGLRPLRPGLLRRLLPDPLHLALRGKFPGRAPGAVADALPDRSAGRRAAGPAGALRWLGRPGIGAPGRGADLARLAAPAWPGNATLTCCKPWQALP